MTATGDLIRSPAWGNVPFPVTQAIEYGFRPDWYMYTGDYGLRAGTHGGVDIGMPVGTNLYSMVDGVVGGSRIDAWGTHVVQITDARGYVLVYQHLQSVAVGDGSRVKAGQFIGISGSANGPHLHFELRVPADTVSGFQLVDPGAFLNDPTVTPDTNGATVGGVPDYGTGDADIKAALKPLGQRSALFVVGFVVLAIAVWRITR